MGKGACELLVRLSLFATCHMGNADVRGEIAILVPKRCLSAHKVVPPPPLRWSVALPILYSWRQL